MLKLHLGCGTVHIPGFRNIDIRYLPGVDEVNNIRYLKSYSHDSVDLIYCSHVLEHFSRWEYENVLERWFSILKPGGILRLAVPDFEAVVYHYLKTKDINTILGLLYGGQDYPENYHYCCWDAKKLFIELESVGFVSIKRYDWHKTEHANIDDASQAYLPHMDKTNGTLMSLNVEATKP